MADKKLIPRKKDNDIQKEINFFRDYLAKANEKLESNIQNMNDSTPDRQKINSERKEEQNKNRPTLNQKTRIRGSKVAKNGIKLRKRI